MNKKSTRYKLQEQISFTRRKINMQQVSKFQEQKSVHNLFHYQKSARNKSHVQFQEEKN